MVKKLTIVILFASVFILSACGGVQTPVPTTEPSATAPLLPTVVSPTQGATSTEVSPTQAATPTAGASNSGLPDISTTSYIDDLSTPAALMLSFFNAINRHEYLRAYSYYQDQTSLGTLDQFSNGYSNTQSVSVVFGNISSDGAAGSIYFTVPMVLNATTTSGTQQKFAACYILQLPEPGNYGAPPISPMHIYKGTAQSVPLTTSDPSALASACPSPDFQVGPDAKPAAVESLADLSNANYIDNRSDPVAVISSLMNAINRMEYVRAFSYWQNPTFTYSSFAAGYANTASVTAQFGTATADPGAGNIFYTLPVVLKSTLKDGTQQTFSVCYTLHLAQPGIQGTLPFQPLGIKSAVSKQVDNNSDAASLLASACQQ